MIADVQALLERFRVAWQAVDETALAGILHPDVVFVHPGWSRQSRGRDACVDTYRQFMAAAKITAYEEPEAAIDVWGNTATAVVRWRMAWEMDGAAHEERGRDILTLARDEDRWQILWRTQIPEGT